MATVLVVEDEILISMSIASALIDVGFDVRTEDEGLSALMSMRDIDAAIIDLGLPDYSGADVARELRRQYPQMLIVLCTGYDASTLDDLANALNVIVIEKPVAEARLVSLIEDHCANNHESRFGVMARANVASGQVSCNNSALTKPSGRSRMS
jgi:DNA-binding response OmpR family regulator